MAHFWTRNARKSIKVSKDSDSGLVSIEIFSETLSSSGCAQVRYQQSKMAKYQPCLWRHSQKKQNQEKIFSLQSQRLAKSSGGFNRSLAQSAEELCGGYVNQNIPGSSQFPSTIYS